MFTFIENTKTARKFNSRPISTQFKARRPTEKCSAPSWTSPKTLKGNANFWSAAKAVALNSSNLEQRMLATSATNQIMSRNTLRDMKMTAFKRSW